MNIHLEKETLGIIQKITEILETDPKDLDKFLLSLIEMYSLRANTDQINAGIFMCNYH